ncbi:MAG: DUF2791 family P-loop domain-containing protein [Candidatus Sumerlaeota bacterium]|nr:DUF2791 family P-loop domain-containing protein [Candidatus Sumerlaeota bacterium]
MADLTQIIARRIVESVGQSGTPPESGFQYFTAGLEPYLNCLETDYFSSYIRDGGSAFKMVEGVYGGGKTHFLYCVRDLAWKFNFDVSYVVLSPHSTPFHAMDKVYAAIAGNLRPRMSPEELLSGYESGVSAYLKRWYMEEVHSIIENGTPESDAPHVLRERISTFEGIESISFAKAAKNALYALLDDNDEQFVNICQWLHGEGYVRQIHQPLGVLERIDKTNAFKMLRSLTQLIRQMGHSGLVVLLDEAEQRSSMSTQQKGILQSNLRELIDACGHTFLQGVMVFYAVPDEAFLEGRTQVYEALRQRLSTTFDDLNPTGVRISLEKTVVHPEEFLAVVGKKLAAVYEVAFGHRFDPAMMDTTIACVARKAYEQRYADAGYKRLFVQMLIRGLHFVRANGRPPEDSFFMSNEG